MKYQQLNDLIKNSSRPGSVPGLERVIKLCSVLGNPQDSLNFIHVAGTNGKGSVCSFLESVYTEAGFKVGFYSSPHLVELNERYRINKKDISDIKLVELLTDITKICETLTDKPTEFEILTAAAFLYFKKNNCDIVILETGLGGRFDATNIIKSPLCSVITSISIDHTDFLGNDLKQIAYEKAGIIKPGSCVVLGDFEKARQFIIDYAKSVGQEITTVDKDLIIDLFHSTNYQQFEYKNTAYQINLIGKHQLQNAAIAIETIATINETNQKFSVSEQDIKDGLLQTQWNARFQLFETKGKTIILDGAHNVSGAKSLCNSVKRHFENKNFAIVTGILKDKEWEKIIDHLVSISNDFYIITPNNARALLKEDIYNYIISKHNVNANVESSLSDAVEKALDSDNDGIIVCGSLYLAGEFLEQKIQKNLNKCEKQ